MNELVTYGVAYSLSQYRANSARGIIRAQSFRDAAKQVFEGFNDKSLHLWIRHPDGRWNHFRRADVVGFDCGNCLKCTVKNGGCMKVLDSGGGIGEATRRMYG